MHKPNCYEKFNEAASTPHKHRIYIDLLSPLCTDGDSVQWSISDFREHIFEKDNAYIDYCTEFKYA